ncbi:tail fiber domain-containing protein [Bradyrhizobium denitrificans]|uniref:tail fiber domain-containing protein n=1 Tax=Bradyrhizobium denitrificans TaxID=2734912 RepID=UPI001551726C|nr:tail fiber domain-containing protein [Bradyrhizobium sp. LMG 8443]NPU23927.1 tail fiber domain-containing protein [Bradyrhizobium sp. LMG 8443]
MTITHQIKTNANPLSKVGSVASQLSGLIAQAQSMVNSGVGLPGLQNIGSQIASLAPSLADAGGPPQIASALVALGNQMSSSTMSDMAGILSSLAGQMSKLTDAINQAGLAQVLHSHVLDALQGIVHSAFGGQHTVKLGGVGIDIASSAKVAHTAPKLPHNGFTMVSDALAVTKGITGQSFGMLSDRRLKTKVRQHPPVLGQVLKLRLKTFLVRALDFETGEVAHEVAPRFSVGFIAQQFAKVFPHLVTRNGKYLEVEEGKVAAILTLALQEFVAETRARVSDLEREIAELKRR